MEERRDLVNLDMDEVLLPTEPYPPRPSAVAATEGPSVFHADLPAATTKHRTGFAPIRDWCSARTHRGPRIAVA